MSPLVTGVQTEGVDGGKARPLPPPPASSAGLSRPGRAKDWPDPVSFYRALGLSLPRGGVGRLRRRLLIERLEPVDGVVPPLLPFLVSPSGAAVNLIAVAQPGDQSANDEHDQKGQEKDDENIHGQQRLDARHAPSNGGALVRPTPSPAVAADKAAEKAPARRAERHGS